MPRYTSPAVLEQIRTLASEGLTQTDIAARLGFKQPNISKIMRTHGIERRRNKAVPVKHGTTTYRMPEGEIAFHVNVTCNGETLQGFLNCSSEQLRELADYANSIKFTQQEAGESAP